MVELKTVFNFHLILFCIFQMFYNKHLLSQNRVWYNTVPLHTHQNDWKEDDTRYPVWHWSHRNSLTARWECQLVQPLWNTVSQYQPQLHIHEDPCYLIYYSRPEVQAVTWAFRTRLCRTPTTASIPRRRRNHELCCCWGFKERKLAGVTHQD